MIVAGFGCRAEASPEALVAALRAALEVANAALPERVSFCALAAPEDRQRQLAPLAARLELPLLVVAVTELHGQKTFTRSAQSLAARGCGSVCEAAALAAAGKGSHLVVTRQISPDRMATCAIAQGEF